MQTTYATHLPLPSQPDGHELDAAIAALRAWVQRRFRITIEPLVGGRAERDGVHVEWTLLTGEAGGLFGTWIDQPDADPLWRWRTYADLGVQHGAAWFRVRVQLYSTEEGLLTVPHVGAGRPGVVRELVRELGIELDGHRLGPPIDVTRDAAEDYVAFIEDPQRRLPIVAISADADGEPFIDPVRTADRLLGLAHVAALDDDGAWAVTKALGKRLSCYQGAVRIYWPGFGRGDDPYHHRLYVFGALDVLGPDGLQGELFDQLGRLAGLSIDEPVLRRALILERRAAEVDQRVEERAETLARVANAAAAEGAVTAEEFAEFAKEFEALETTVTLVEQDALEGQVEVERLRAERDAARRQVAELSRAFAQAGAAEAPEVVEPPATVLEAVERARAEAEQTVYLPEALKSAEASEYDDPSRVLDDLRLIEGVARDWASGLLPMGPHEAFRERTAAYRADISQTAETQYATDYEREWKGFRVTLRPHLRRGTGAVSSIMRIYMHFDTESKQIVVGHVGRKLRDASNRN
jgi:predicted flap endonuclease-1-like 5' DNA nuclease